MMEYLEIIVLLLGLAILLGICEFLVDKFEEKTEEHVIMIRRETNEEKYERIKQEMKRKGYSNKAIEKTLDDIKLKDIYNDLMEE